MNSSDTNASAKPSPQGPNSIAAAAASAGFKLGCAAVMALLLIVAGTAAGLIPRWNQRAQLQADTQELTLLTVSVVSPAPGKAVAALPLPAEVKPLVEAPIHARASGYVIRCLVDIGSQVKPGELLAEIDTPELHQEIARSRAEQKEAEAALELAKTTAARWAGLLKTASVSEQEAAEKKADLALKSATVEAARANLQRLEELESMTNVIAPFSGTITERQTDVGQLISSGSNNELFRLAQTSTLRVYVRVPQSVARNVAVGQMAELVIPELPGRVFPAKVVRTAGAMDAQSRTLLTELEVDNAKGTILPGSYAQVRFPEGKGDGTLTLSSNTLLFRAEGTQVGVVRPDNTVELRNIVVGRDFGPTVEILQGVTPSDRVIMNPPDSLVKGAKVRVAEAPKGGASK